MYFFPITVKQNGDIPASYVSLPVKFSHPHSMQRLRNAKNFDSSTDQGYVIKVLLDHGLRTRNEKIASSSLDVACNHEEKS